MPKQQTIYELLNTSKENVEGILKKLDDYDKGILLKRYDNNLDGFPTGDLTEKEKSYFYGTVLPRMRKFLRNNSVNTRIRKNRTITSKKLELLPLVKNNVENITDEVKKEIIKLFFGLVDGQTYSQTEIAKKFDVTQTTISSIIRSFVKSIEEETKNDTKLDNQDGISEPESTIVEELKETKNKGKIKKEEEPIELLVEEENKPNNEELEDIPNLPVTTEEIKLTPEPISKKEEIPLTSSNELLKNPLFNSIICSLMPKEAMIVLLRLGFVDNRCFSTEELAKFLNMDEDEIRVIVRQTLQFYQSKVNEYINTITSIAIDEENLTR
jgi:DNA-directed RNA polymerase specialized sigma24 family protein